jgi:hypothetical protein
LGASTADSEEQQEGLVQQYGSIKLLEQNDILLQRISREFASQMEEIKFEENLLNQFYEITQKLNTLTDLDVLIEHSLNSLVEISEADGGILSLHPNPNLPDAWEYRIFKNVSHESKYYDQFENLCAQVLKAINWKTLNSQILRLYTTTSWSYLSQSVKTLWV